MRIPIIAFVLIIVTNTCFSQNSVPNKDTIYYLIDTSKQINNQKPLKIEPETGGYITDIEFNTPCLVNGIKPQFTYTKRTAVKYLSKKITKPKTAKKQMGTTTQPPFISRSPKCSSFGATVTGKLA